MECQDCAWAWLAFSVRCATLVPAESGDEGRRPGVSLIVERVAGLASCLQITHGNPINDEGHLQSQPWHSQGGCKRRKWSRGLRDGPGTTGCAALRNRRQSPRSAAQRFAHIMRRCKAMESVCVCISVRVHAQSTCASAKKLVCTCNGPEARSRWSTPCLPKGKTSGSARSRNSRHEQRHDDAHIDISPAVPTCRRQASKDRESAREKASRARPSWKIMDYV